MTRQLNEYDFLARTYVASQCRFTTLDPLAEKTPWLSPYAYCAGNPVNFIDPDGRHTRVRDIGAVSSSRLCNKRAHKCAEI